MDSRGVKKAVVYLIGWLVVAFGMLLGFASAAAPTSAPFIASGVLIVVMGIGTLVLAWNMPQVPHRACDLCCEECGACQKSATQGCPHCGQFDPRCRRCGYDLTGNVSGLCPECACPATPPGSCRQVPRH